MEKRYGILYARGKDFGAMRSELINSAYALGTVIRLVFFGEPEDNGEYLGQLAAINEEVGKVFGGKRPAVSYIAQKPLFGSLLAAEVTYVDRCYAGSLSYGDNCVNVEYGGYKEIVTGALLPENINGGFFEQSQEVFVKLGSMLSANGFRIGDIYRQWNYIEDITKFDGECQHYQDFNDARSDFYSGTEWDGGYPAATGIGTALGGVAVELNAIVAKDGSVVDKALDNKLQVSAHRYSQQVLKGEINEGFDHKTTPKFERARLVGSGNDYTVYVSGTAAIRGEESLEGTDAAEQTRITMENIEYLLSEECTGIHGYMGVPALLRIYIKHTEDLAAVRDYMEKHYPQPAKLYVHADVCREELLVEIEGIAPLAKI